MNLGDLRTAMLGLLNRDDCTADQANQFIAQALQRLQRSLRVPAMERLMVWNSDPLTATALTQLAIPDDFIQTIDILWKNDGSAPGHYDIGAMIALDRMSFRELQQVHQNGPPRAYARYQAAFYLRGTIPASSETHLYYYGEFLPIAVDSDENEIMASSPDLVIYAALALAGDYFQHPKASSWLEYAGVLRDEVQTMANDVDSNGGSTSVAAAYGAY